MLELKDFLIEKPVTLIYWNLEEPYKIILPNFQSVTEIKSLEDFEDFWEWNKAVNVKYLIIGVKEKEKLEEIKRSLSKLPIDQRRRLFIIYISPHLKTLDRIQAFLYGVNLVVNSNDLENLDKILNKSMVYWEALYKPYYKALEKMWEE